MVAILASAELGAKPQAFTRQEGRSARCLAPPPITLSALRLRALALAASTGGLLPGERSAAPKVFYAAANAWLLAEGVACRHAVLR